MSVIRGQVSTFPQVSIVVYVGRWYVFITTGLNYLFIKSGVFQRGLLVEKNYVMFLEAERAYNVQISQRSLSRNPPKSAAAAAIY
jgi:hypothetical protein